MTSPKVANKIGQDAEKRARKRASERTRAERRSSPNGTRCLRRAEGAKETSFESTAKENGFEGTWVGLAWNETPEVW